MAFNIHQKVFNQDGEPLEKIAAQYRKDLFKLFMESPEGQALIDEGIEPGWADMMMDYGMNYLRLTPPQMSPADLREVLFDLFPRKVSADADEAPNVIRELQAFWTFLQREFQLENAAACLRILDDKAARRLREEMSDPANFGIAKSFVMMGKARGFDMTTEEGINEWMTIYNAEIAAGIGQRVNVPDFPFPFPAARRESARKGKDKTRRKMVSNSRRKNRKKWHLS
jgi:hypothetical protein